MLLNCFSFKIKWLFFFSSESQKNSKDIWLTYRKVMYQGNVLDLGTYDGNVTVSFFTGSWRKQEQVLWCPQIWRMDTRQLPSYERPLDGLSRQRSSTWFSHLFIRHRKQWLVNTYHVSSEWSYIFSLYFYEI